MTRSILMVIFGLITTTSFAHQIHNGQLLSHKSWMSPGGIGKLNPISVDAAKNKMMQLKNNKLPHMVDDYNEMISPYVHQEQNALTLGTHELSGSVYLAIVNGTYTPQTYTITTEFCISSRGSESVCNTVEDVVSISNLGSLQYALQPTVTYDFTTTEPVAFRQLSLKIRNNLTKTVVSTGSNDPIEITQ